MGYACFGFIFRISFYTEDLVFTVLAQMIFPLKFFLMANVAINVMTTAFHDWVIPHRGSLHH